MTHGSKETVSAFDEGTEIVCVMYADNGKLQLTIKPTMYRIADLIGKINTSPDSRYYKLNINDSEGSIAYRTHSYADGSRRKNN